jgi:hypothetical protein
MTSADQIVGRRPRSPERLLAAEQCGPAAEATLLIALRGEAAHRVGTSSVAVSDMIKTIPDTQRPMTETMKGGTGLIATERRNYRVSMPDR